MRIVISYIAVAAVSIAVTAYTLLPVLMDIRATLHTLALTLN